MPRFDTPEPIQATIELGIGDVRISASDRSDTVLVVRPTDGANADDVAAVEQTRVDYMAGRLLVKAPKKNWRRWSLFSDGGSVDVTIELPAGSHVQGIGIVAAFRGEGRLGECRIHTGPGDIQLEQTGPLDVVTAGAVTVACVAGDAGVSTASGSIRLGQIEGAAVLKNSNGNTWVGEVTGDVRCQTAHGDIVVEVAHAGITAHTANGNVRVGDAVRGMASLKTACGQIEIGIHAGTAAYLDVFTAFGRVHNPLGTIEGPEPSEETVEVHARTSYGDIVIHRSATHPMEHSTERR